MAAAVTGAATTAAALAVLAPLGDPQPEPSPHTAFWQLPTGSRLAHLHMPAAGRARPTPVVVLHGGPGIPDLAGDAAYFGPLTALGYDVHLCEQLGAGLGLRHAVRRAVRPGRPRAVGPPPGGPHVALARPAHRRGARFADDPDPALLAIGVEEVLAAAATVRR